MIKGFEFVADGRTYVCTTEERRGTSGEFWWWFTVTGDASSYAPFQAASNDTRSSVERRIVEYYTNRLLKRSEPTPRGGHWGRRPPTDAAAAPAKPPTQASA